MTTFTETSIKFLLNVMRWIRKRVQRTRDCLCFRLLSYGHAVRYGACFQASAAVQVRYALFWNFEQCRFLACCRRFGTIYQLHFKGSSSAIGCAETSVTNYQSTLRKIQEERRSQSLSCPVQDKSVECSISCTFL